MKSAANPRMIYQTDETRGKIVSVARSLFTERGLFDMLFGCWHRKYTFPITADIRDGHSAHSNKMTYVVCLDCGKEFPYDWEKMKVLSGAPEPVRRARPTALPVTAAATHMHKAA